MSMKNLILAPLGLLMLLCTYVCAYFYVYAYEYLMLAPEC